MTEKEKDISEIEKNTNKKELREKVQSHARWKFLRYKEEHEAFGRLYHNEDFEEFKEEILKYTKEKRDEEEWKFMFEVWQDTYNRLTLDCDEILWTEDRKKESECER